jgi:hypothetical protein
LSTSSVCYTPKSIGVSCSTSEECSSSLCGSSNTCVYSTGSSGCTSNSQCQASWCNTDTTICVSTSCGTSMKDGLETDINCGMLL